METSFKAITAPLIREEIARMTHAEYKESRIDLYLALIVPTVTFIVGIAVGAFFL